MKFNPCLIIITVLLCAAYLTGCAAHSVSPVTGLLYTEVSAPFAVADGSTTGMKVGKSTAKSILGLIARGDASISAAAKDGGITTIHYVDYESKNTLGIIATFTVIVYGE